MISPVEIETALRAMPDRDCAVVGVADPIMDERSRRWFPDGANAAAGRRLRAAARVHAPRYVELIALPKTETEKVQRHKLQYVDDRVDDAARAVKASRRCSGGTALRCSLCSAAHRRRLAPRRPAASRSRSTCPSLPTSRSSADAITRLHREGDQRARRHPRPPVKLSFPTRNPIRRRCNRRTDRSRNTCRSSSDPRSSRNAWRSLRSSCGRPGELPRPASHRRAGAISFPEWRRRPMTRLPSSASSA